ncbi:MAG TPA: PadR family transcriptional regulator [Candidatus Dormibacteraeota bacterium]|jgi:DNA-binding PadR family transcriptional regulator|nr:PadR family transcriptional regulator [Candidatus Dormibacteraeota bacterium]
MSRRRVDNLLGLAVLSVLFSRPMHPYEIARELRVRGKDEDMEIKWGSFYTVVRNLEKHGLIEARASSRQGARPERTVYGITGAGREELEDWTRELIAVPRPERPSFKAGLSVLGGLGPDEAATLLERRLLALQTRIAGQQASLERDRQQVPRLFLIESEYDLTLLEAEAAWIRGLLQELRDGSFPGLEEWRAFLGHADDVDGAEAGRPMA